MMAGYVLLCLCSFLLIGLSVAEIKITDNDTSLRDNMREFVKHTMACRGVPGVTVSAVRWNTTIIAEGYGQRDVTLPLHDPRANVTSKTRFMIGSLSKAFTTTLLAKIIAGLKGSNRFSSEITWDTPIRNILGNEFRLYDDVRSEQTTIKDLLTHRLGYPPYMTPFALGMDTGHTRREYCGRLFTMEPVLGFRDRYFYNNHMYTLAGCVAEALGGDTYENLVEKHLFRPLGMNDSWFSDANMKYTDDFAIPYMLNRNESGFVQLDPLTLGIFPAEPAGAVYSTADDMSRWMKMLVAEGRLNGEQLVDKTQLQETWKPAVSTELPMTTPPRFPIFPLQLYVWLGLASGQLQRYPAYCANVAAERPLGQRKTEISRCLFLHSSSEASGYRRYEHSGYISAYCNLISILPDKGLAVFSSANSGLRTDAILLNRMIDYYVTDRLLGNEPWLNLTTACTYPEPWMQIGTTRSAKKARTRRQTLGEEDLNTILLALSQAENPHVAEDELLTRGVRSNTLNPSGRVVNDVSRTTEGWHTRYIGMYGHLLFGNITITHNATTNDLRFAAGRFGTGVMEKVTDQEETFYCHLYGPSWYLQGTGRDPRQRIPFTFNKLVEGKFQELIATGYESLAPPVFTRGRKWTDVNNPTTSKSSTILTSYTSCLIASLVLCTSFISM